MNFKVKCVAYRKPELEQYFTIGKVYEVEDGAIVSDNGFKYDDWSYGGNHSFELLQKWFDDWYEFELVTEDEPEEHDTKVDPIKEVNFDKANLTTTIVWRDGTTTTAVAQDRKVWSEQSMFVFAYCKRLLGNDDTLVKAVMKWVVER